MRPQRFFAPAEHPSPGRRPPSPWRVAGEAADSCLSPLADLPSDASCPPPPCGAPLLSAESTCWTVTRGAALGSAGDREEFARRYLPVIRAYLSSRWRHSPHLRDLDDAVQEVFVECFGQGGVLARA